MTEGTRALRAVKLWDTWGRALAAGGDLDALLAAAEPRIVAARPATRIRVSLSHGGSQGQVVLELRVDFAGAPRATLGFDGITHTTTAVSAEDRPSEWHGVTFGGKYLEFRLIHEAIPKLMDAVYARSTFIPQLRELGKVARVSGLETARDATLGAAQRVRFSRRYGQDARDAYARMGFELTDARGAPFTEADEQRLEDKQGPNYIWPSGVAWRRGDATIHDADATFGADAKRILPR